MGLWVLAGAWSADNLTDGRVPAYMVAELGCKRRSAEQLVQAGLWQKVDDGYQFYAWNEDGRQPTRAEVEASREAEKIRKAEWRARSKAAMSQRDRTGTDSGTPTGTDAGTPAGVRTPRPDPSRPVRSYGLGSQSSEPSSANRAPDGLDLDKIANTLKQPPDWARRVAADILGRAGNPKDPTAYVIRAIRAEPKRYQPTQGPPPVERICLHGRDRLTCPDCEAQTAGAA